LFRNQLGNEGHEIARKSSSVLLGNAEKFYRGAKALAMEKGVANEAAIKEALAKMLSGDKEGLIEVSKVSGENVVKDALVDFWQEGMISGEEMENVTKM